MISKVFWKKKTKPIKQTNKQMQTKPRTLDRIE